MDINTIIALITQAKDFRPVVTASIEEIKEFYLPLIEQLGDYVFAEGSDARIKAFKKFRDELGVDNAIAAQLTINLFDMFKQGAK